MLSKKHQQLPVLQNALDDTSSLPGILVPIVELPVLLCIIMALYFRLDENGDQSMGLQTFVLVNHMA